jgi:hypothetical protein
MGGNYRLAGVIRPDDIVTGKGNKCAIFSVYSTVSLCCCAKTEDFGGQGQMAAKCEETKKRSIKSRPPINTHTHVPIKQHPTDTPLFRRIIILLQKGT